VTVALVVGTIELLQVLAARLGLTDGFWSWLGALDFGKLGYGIVAIFVLTWVASVVVWKARRIEERWSELVVPSRVTP
jgi:high-affinity nickel-transport protein